MWFDKGIVGSSEGAGQVDGARRRQPNLEALKEPAGSFCRNQANTKVHSARMLREKVEMKSER